LKQHSDKLLFYILLKIIFNIAYSRVTLPQISFFPQLPHSLSVFPLKRNRRLRVNNKIHMWLGWPCGTSVRGEALGLLKGPSIGECQDRKVGVSRLVSRRRGGGIGGFFGGEMRKGDNI
jgi:hypothetical protein